MFVSFNGITAGVTNEASTAKPCGSLEFTPVLVGFVLLDLLFCFNTFYSQQDGARDFGLYKLSHFYMHLLSNY